VGVGLHVVWIKVNRVTLLLISLFS